MTRTAAATSASPALPDSADDGWDMPPRREGQVMAEMPKGFASADPDRPLPTGRGLLSPAEIEALLRPDLSDLAPDPVPETAEARAFGDFTAAPADAGAQDRDCARRMAARLSLAMRESCGLPVAALASGMRRAPFAAAVRQGEEERGQAIACFASPGGDIGAMMILSAGLAQLLIETACGARLRPGAVRPLSPIDLAVLEALVRPLAPAISPDLSFSSLETDTVFAASIAPPSEALTADLSMRIQADAFRAQVILVAPAAPVVLSAPQSRATGLQGALSVTLTARVASLSVPLSRLSGLKPGSTLLLGVPADQPVELMSGTEPVVLAAEAEIGRRGGRIALRITRRGPALGTLIRPS
jgi:flagellar motor switch protein FliM